MNLKKIGKNWGCLDNGGAQKRRCQRCTGGGPRGVSAKAGRSAQAAHRRQAAEAVQQRRPQRGVLRLRRQQREGRVGPTAQQPPGGVAEGGRGGPGGGQALHAGLDGGRGQRLHHRGGRSGLLSQALPTGEAQKTIMRKKHQPQFLSFLSVP